MASDSTSYPRRVWETGEDGVVSRLPDAEDLQRRAANALGFPVQRVSLPETYERARQALAECERVDECQQWNDKAWALQAYARQVQDDELMRMAMRIRLRALRQCGQLLMQFDKRGWYRSKAKADQPSQMEIAQAAGLSKSAARHSVRIAHMPDDDFESAVESSQPPSVYALFKSLPPVKRPGGPKYDGEAQSAGATDQIWPEHDAIRELRDAVAAYVKRLPPTQGKRLRSALHNLGPLDESEREE